MTSFSVLLVSLTNILLRTPITQMIFFNQVMVLLGSNHFFNWKTNCSLLAAGIWKLVGNFINEELQREDFVSLKELLDRATAEVFHPNHLPEYLSKPLTDSLTDEHCSFFFNGGFTSMTWYGHYVPWWNLRVRSQCDGRCSNAVISVYSWKASQFGNFLHHSPELDTP